jgi:hypothetical protein
MLATTPTPMAPDSLPMYLGERLKHLSGTTETDFLELGDLLYQFTQLSQENDSLSNQLLELLNNTSWQPENMQRALSELLQEFRETQKTLQLSLFQKHAGMLQELQNSLRNATQHMQMLAELLRTREDNENSLFLFSNTVRVMCLEMDIRSQELQGTSEMYVQQLFQLITRDIEQSHPDLHLLDVQQQLLGNFRNMVHVHAQLREHTQSIQENGHSITRSLAKAVVSLQFHDIVRQQIEHVGDAFQCPGSLKHNAVRELLQLHLLHAHQQTETVHGDISQQFGALARHAQEQYRHTQAILHLEPTLRRLSEMGTRDMEFLLQRVALQADHTRQRLTLLEDLQKIGDDVSQQLQHLRSMMQQLQELAFNARVYAGSIRNERAPEVTLLHEFSQAAENSQPTLLQGINEIEIYLRAIRTMQEQLHQQVAAELKTGERLRHHLYNTIERFQQSASEILEQTSEVAASVETLSLNLNFLLQDLSFAPTIYTELEQTRQFLKIFPPLSPSADSDGGAALQHIFQSYSQEPERLIHQHYLENGWEPTYQRILGKEPLHTEAASPAVIDDDIELF